MVDRLAPASLMLMAVLWGSTFFVLKDMLARMDASDLLAVRFTIAALLLLVVLRRRLRMDATTVRHGLVMGALYGRVNRCRPTAWPRPASISGFLTGLYVVMTPILEAVLLKARVGRRVCWRLRWRPPGWAC